MQISGSTGCMDIVGFSATPGEHTGWTGRLNKAAALLEAHVTTLWPECTARDPGRVRRDIVAQVHSSSAHPRAGHGEVADAVP
mmetsp:Transcript_21264/g.48582  ORF Transcript_21264/g.48582 Transcript_21264/m.48582 type:complete len:83 (+) Transcript_21264:651-899(+)